MEKHYSLHGFVIVETENILEWIEHVGDFCGTGDMMYLRGWAYIHQKYDVTLLGKTRTLNVENELRNFTEVERYLQSLPKWNKTKYYVKLADLRLFSLLECETGESVYSDINPEIFRSLVTGEDQQYKGLYT
jgi:hypothetical protein